MSQYVYFIVENSYTFFSLDGIIVIGNNFVYIYMDTNNSNLSDSLKSMEAQNPHAMHAAVAVDNHEREYHMYDIKSHHRFWMFVATAFFVLIILLLFIKGAGVYSG